jgi:hypothetical protein
MGLHDRDYMKRSPDDDARRGSSPDEKLESFVSGFLTRHPKLPIVIGIALIVLVFAVVIGIKLANASH